MTRLGRHNCTRLSCKNVMNRRRMARTARIPKGLVILIRAQLGPADG